MSESFVVVIPARYGSTRFPGKALADLDGRPVIQHVYQNAVGASAAAVIVATDDERIASVARQFGADVAMTRADHLSGTDRIAEVAAQRGWPDEQIVVNVQGDAPLLPATSIERVARSLAEHPSAAMATLAVPLFDDGEYANPNVVKVVFDRSGRALYFSRASIPAGIERVTADGRPSAFRHIGIYAYRVAALIALSQGETVWLEQHEKLEQLRALWMGFEIRVEEVMDIHGPDIDTPEDLVAARNFLRDRARSGVKFTARDD